MKKTFNKLKIKKPYQAGLTGLFLALLSFIYSPLLRMRLMFYRLGLLPSRKVSGAKVISIGNLSVGGTGKTPVTIMLALFIKQLSETKDKKIAVVSRGYGRKSTRDVQIISDGKKLLARYPDAADEAILTAGELMGKAMAISSPKRIDGIKVAVEKLGMNTILLDDAFSHLQVKRDLNILLVDAINPFGNGWLFPAGHLREPLSSIERADIVFITRANFSTDKNLRQIIKGIQKAKSGIEILHVDISADKVILPSGERKSAQSFLAGKKINLLSGIASPKQFEDTVKELGGAIGKHYAFPDHHCFSKNEIKKATSGNGTDLPTLTTQKDFTRIPDKQKSLFCQLTIKASIREDWILVDVIRDTLKTRSRN